jgi:tripartite-type tricarboxylate transporter receptor subunit TctC
MRHLLMAVVALVLGAAGPAVAQDAAAFFRGKQVKFVVGNSVGGGFDTYARMLAPHLAKALDASVIVQNQPGASGLTAINSVYGSPGDALRLIMINGNAAALAQLIEDPSVRFDLTKMGMLALVASSPRIWIGSPKSSRATLADFIKPGAKSTWVGTGQLGGASDGAAITCYALKMDCRIVRGYEGSAAGALALARGEADALYSSDTSANSYVLAGNAKPILTMSREKSQYFKDLPTVFEALPLTEEQKWWFEFRGALDDLQRILTAPPDVPPAQLAYLREAVRKVLTDPEVIAEGEKTERYIEYQDAAAVQKMIATVLVSISPERKNLVREVILKE